VLTLHYNLTSYAHMIYFIFRTF